MVFFFFLSGQKEKEAMAVDEGCPGCVGTASKVAQVHVQGVTLRRATKSGWVVSGSGSGPAPAPEVPGHVFVLLTTSCTT